tara:strand:- start:132 stop:638 length:507 start_codon:yes stop_codon:yes gene_type:complete
MNELHKSISVVWNELRVEEEPHIFLQNSFRFDIWFSIVDELLFRIENSTNCDDAIILYDRLFTFFKITPEHLSFVQCCKKRKKCFELLDEHIQTAHIHDVNKLTSLSNTWVKSRLPYCRVSCCRRRVIDKNSPICPKHVDERRVMFNIVNPYCFHVKDLTNIIMEYTY